MSQLPRYGPAACPSKDLVFGSTGRPPGCPGIERRVELRRRRPGTAPIVVGSRWRVGRPRSRFPRRRRRGLHDGVAMNAPRSCCSERRRRAGLGRRTGASGRRAVSHTARKVQAGESRIGADASEDVPWPARARRSPPRRLQFAQLQCSNLQRSSAGSEMRCLRDAARMSDAEHLRLHCNTCVQPSCNVKIDKVAILLVRLH